MSFLTDLFEGHFSSLGTDITHAGSSLASHPDELAETLGGAAALATGGLALGGGLGALGGLFGGAADTGILTGGDALGISAGDFATASQAGEATLDATAGDAGLPAASSLTAGGPVAGGLPAVDPSALAANAGIDPSADLTTG